MPTPALLDDPLDDIFNGVGSERPVVTPPANYEGPRYEEPCKKCRGSGQFIGRNGRALGPCFACRETPGKAVYKTSPQTRAANRASVVRTQVSKLESFKVTHPAEFALIEAEAPRWEFAAKMLEVVTKYGGLSDGQMAVIERAVARKAERVVEAKAREASAPTVALSRIQDAFAKASRHLKSPVLHLDRFTFSFAGPASKNPGFIYVRSGENYLGKIGFDGRFLAVRSCGAESAQEVVTATVDPEAAAIRYGRLTGRCGCCNRTLTKAESVTRGIGPKCAERFGW